MKSKKLSIKRLRTNLSQFSIRNTESLKISQTLKKKISMAQQTLVIKIKVAILIMIETNILQL